MTRIRPYVAADAPALRGIFTEAVQVGARAQYSAAQRDAWSGAAQHCPPDWGDRLGDHLTFVAEQDGDPVGFMTLGRDGHLDLAFVLPQVMGQGVADALHDRILAEAQARGLSRLTTEASLRAQPFFRRMGWRLVAHQTVEIRGQRLDNAVMEKPLQALRKLPPR
ncbi:GNAT family N-acetyltransferase [Fluviibacterium sp. DFM31]|uniref:GNAT family N-acetyltransferase n=1 Tax=Meridianimarinicoccus marinus TaxID=3231483 RepID=A0ABV3LAN1_9RHOB